MTDDDLISGVHSVLEEADSPPRDLGLLQRVRILRSRRPKRRRLTAGVGALVVVGVAVGTLSTSSTDGGVNAVVLVEPTGTHLGSSPFPAASSASPKPPVGEQAPSATATYGGGPNQPAPDAVHPSEGISYPFNLYDHCGINTISFGRRFWLAVDPPGAGAATAPQGWNNPYQQGFVTLLSPNGLRFKAQKNLPPVEFRPTADAEALCS